MDSLVNEMEEDHFSQLSHDCLLSVFCRVDRETLDKVELLSQRIGVVVNNKSLSRIKIEGELFIYEQLTGHSFTVNRKDGQFSLSFHMDRLDRTAKRTQDKRLYDEFNYPSENSFGVKEQHILAHGSLTPIPSKLYRHLADMLRRYSCERIVFQWIRVDQAFVKKMLSVDERVAGSSKKFKFYCVEFDDCLHPQRFAEFVLEYKPTELMILTACRSIPNLPAFLKAFGQKFVASFASRVPEHIDPGLGIVIFSSGKEEVDLRPYFWTPPNDFLPVLTRFRVFRMQNMILTPENLVELMMICFEQNRERFYDFPLSGEMTTDHLQPFTGSSEFAVELDTEEWEEDPSILSNHFIRKKGSTLLCKCCISMGNYGIRSARVRATHQEKPYVV